METQLEEANEVAKTSNQKFEDANRKLKVYKKIKTEINSSTVGILLYYWKIIPNSIIKVVEGDLERVLERADEFETKGREIETQVNQSFKIKFLTF